ncbi:serine hydrolase [Chryseobacterium sp.]|uniref:serine hydrolase domain-containing protein n=1 Tax=Chryseobacterium sp. TaxID=1871047 RepID=UPI001AFE8AFA|nr:serine hydrolase domain-containing protein [Chryseobacterium sp.]MBO9690826.1 beta-lactamase family protein [Chryseobacterium sp.]
MTHIFKLTFIATAFLFMSCNFSAQTKDYYSARIDSLMNRFHNNGMFNGNVLVSKNNKIIYNCSFGFADANKTTKLTSDYKFNIGSITKEFSAVALMQLIEKGELTLNDKISKIFPELPEWSNKVSIKDLLQYTSGLPDVNWKKIKSNEDIFEDLKAIDTLNFDPGTQYDYNNNNFFLRLSIIEKIGGMSYKDYVQQNIFKPLKMNSAEITPIQENHNIAKGFNNKLIEDKSDFLVGGTFLTTTDLLKFLDNLHSNKIISKNSLFELGQHFNKEDTQSALGEAKFKNKILLEHSHDGRGGSYEALMITNMKNSFSIILLSNNYQGKIFEISQAIISILNN